MRLLPDDSSGWEAGVLLPELPAIYRQRYPTHEALSEGREQDMDDTSTRGRVIELFEKHRARPGAPYDDVRDITEPERAIGGSVPEDVPGSLHPLEDVPQEHQENPTNSQAPGTVV